jgi:uncharacterized protein (DUF433 family)
VATTATKDRKTEYPHVVRTPGVVGGSPRVAGTRLTVSAIADLWTRGDTLDNLLDMFPGLTAAGVHSALAYYWDHRAEVDREIAENDPVNWFRDPTGRWRLRAAE